MSFCSTSLSLRWTRARPRICCISCNAGRERGEPSSRCCMISTEYVDISPRRFCWRARPSPGEIPRFRFRPTILRAPKKRWSRRRAVALDGSRERTAHWLSDRSIRDIRLYANRAGRVLRSRLGERADRHTSAHAPREPGWKCVVACSDAWRGARLSLRRLFLGRPDTRGSANRPCRRGSGRAHGTVKAAAPGRQA